MTFTSERTGVRGPLRALPEQRTAKGLVGLETVYTNGFTGRNIRIRAGVGQTKSQS